MNVSLGLLYANAAYLRSGQAGGLGWRDDGDLVGGGAGERGAGFSAFGGAGAGEPGGAAAAAGWQQGAECFGGDVCGGGTGLHGAADGAQGDGVGDLVGVVAAGGGGGSAGGVGELDGA